MRLDAFLCFLDGVQTPLLSSPRRLSKRDGLAALLATLSLLQIAGDLLGLPVLKGLGAASAMAPLPKVFSDVRGLETFASGFSFELRDSVSGETERRPITPEMYSRLAGPYNRRNAYGAALAYAPRLPEKLWQSVFCFGLKPNDGPLRRELGLPPEAHVTVSIRTKTRGREDHWLLEPPCLP